MEWTYEHSDKSVYSNNNVRPFTINTGSMGMTSTHTTRVHFIDEKTKFTMGDYIHLVIEAFDNNGRRRQRGGDFFEPVMYNTKLQKSTAGRVVDYGNGTYSVYFYAAWQGTAAFNITLAFTREAILFLDHDISYSEPENIWKATLMNGNSSEIINCSIKSEDTWHNMCEYTNAAALGKTVFLCERPSNLTCKDYSSSIHSIKMIDTVTAQKIDPSKDLFRSDTYFGPLNTRKLKAVINGGKIQAKLPPCGPDISVPLSDGYWTDKYTFVPMMCRSQQWSDEEVKTCLSNKKMYISGGSTMWQVYKSLKYDFSVPDDSLEGFSFVALRLGPFFQYVTKLRFESDVVDEVPQEVCNNNTAVFIVNFSFHFVTWATNSYLERLFNTKLAIVRFLNRCPGSMVLIRLSNPRENGQINQRVHSSDWILYNQNRMIRRVFGGIGVRFIDVWDMVLSHHEPNVVHMPMYIIKQEVEVMFSYMCPEMVRDK
ncbi:NXPE family member 3-like [Glandiceps talaboti]